MNLCKCGCGKEVNANYVWGHNRKGCGTNNRGLGWKHKESTLLKLRIPHSEEHNKKVGDALKGRKLSDEHRAKLSVSHLGQSRPQTKETKQKISGIVKNIWKNRTPAEKGIIFKKIFCSNKFKPNKSELFLLSKLKSVSDNWEYVGDGKLWIDGKNPDFINKNTKQIIELFGEYWHKPEDEPIRKAHFEKEGYKVQIIWWKHLTKLEDLLCAL